MTRSSMTTTASTVITSSSSPSADVVTKIKTLLKYDTTTNKNKNKLLVLDDRADAGRLDELRRIFAIHLFPQDDDHDIFNTTTKKKKHHRNYNNNKYNHTDEEDDDDNDDTTTTTTYDSAIYQWKLFLRTSYMEFIQQVSDRIRCYGKRTAVRTLFGIVASSPVRASIQVPDDRTTTIRATTTTTSGDEQQNQQQQQQVSKEVNTYYYYKAVNQQLIYKWIYAIVHASDDVLPFDKGLRHMLSNEFIQPYRDVQYSILVSTIQLANEIYNNKKKNNNNNNHNNKNKFGGPSTRNNQNSTTNDEDEDENNSSSGSMGSSDDESEYADDDDAGNTNNNNDNKESTATTTTTTTTEVVERLIEILMMIPTTRSQKELNQNNSSCLFEPPDICTNNGDDENDPDDDDDDDSSNEDSDDETSSDDEDEEHHRHRTKRRKVADERIPAVCFLQYKAHRSSWGKAWLAVLRLVSMSDHSNNNAQFLKRIFTFVSQHVLPIVTHPLRFTDFFMNAYGTATTSSASISDAGSSTSTNMLVPILALDGLFYLMTQHNLEYNNFYQQLYALIQSSRIMHIKYRVRFYQLLTSCLCNNPMLPAYVVASFIKRLLRHACMAGTPGTVLFVLALTSNLLRQHPETSGLIHRNNTNTIQNKTNKEEDDLEDEHDAKNNKDDHLKQMMIQDVFDPVTNDLEKTNAVQSSLWELNALEHHYYPAVVTLAKSIGVLDIEANQPLHDIMNNYIDKYTYSALFEQERNHHAKKKKKTPLAFRKPTGLFSPHDLFSNVLATPK